MQKLEQFIRSEGELNFDVETAIKVSWIKLIVVNKYADLLTQIYSLALDKIVFSSLRLFY